MKEPRVIAEIGCNHKGEMEIAHEMIKIASIFCEVPAVKFQKRNNREYLTLGQYDAPHPNPYHSYGKTYGEHRDFLEFNIDQHKQLKYWCEEYNVIYSCSVWDMTSAKEIASLDPQYIKIPSALNMHFDMLGWLCDHYEGEIQLSLGMTTKEEEEKIVRFFESRGRNKDLVIYSCTSGYPIEPEEACLMEIPRLIEKYKGVVKEIGYSGHHNGIAIDVAAYTLGATTIERHYTLNRTWKGTDHAASLEPDGLRRLARDLRVTHRALCSKDQDLLEVEKVQREKLKWRQR